MSQKHKTLYRGTSEQMLIGTYKNPYINSPRRPSSVPFKIHQAVDQWFYSAFGVRARSECIFCSLSKATAEKYRQPGGTVNEISPVPSGEVSFIFSEYVDDFIDLISYENYKCENESIAEVVERLESLRYTKVDNTCDIPDGFNGEIMMSCYEYRVLKIG